MNESQSTNHIAYPIPIAGHPFSVTLNENLKATVGGGTLYPIDNVTDVTPESRDVLISSEARLKDADTPCVPKEPQKLLINKRNVEADKGKLCQVY
ncbi:hypothetical protein JTB14_013541 [Gonioctena quinquepunctata]|nr:hypothetical protein JTB14_013541 [Gonioctena quinquepunctata]